MVDFGNTLLWIQVWSNSIRYVNAVSKVMIIRIIYIFTLLNTRFLSTYIIIFWSNFFTIKIKGLKIHNHRKRICSNIHEFGNALPTLPLFVRACIYMYLYICFPVAYFSPSDPPFDRIVCFRVFQHLHLQTIAMKMSAKRHSFLEQEVCSLANFVCAI